MPQDTHLRDSIQPRSAKPLFSNFRWIVVCLLFLATTINYVDRQILALLKSTLDRELGWTNEQYGLVNAAFQSTYALSYVGFGWFIDRYGIKVGYFVSISMWSIAAACHGLVGSVRGFFMARFGLGLGEGGSFPSCIKAVAYWFPRGERHLAASLFNSGANVGPIIAPAIVPFIAAAFGWRMVFVVAGLAGFLWLALWVPFYSAPEKSPYVSEAELETILRDRDLRSNSEGRFDWWRLFAFRETWAYQPVEITLFSDGSLFRPPRKNSPNSHQAQ